MHAASMGEQWADCAAEEAGISALDSMSSAEERLGTLQAIKMVLSSSTEDCLYNVVMLLLGDSAAQCVLAGGVHNSTPRNDALVSLRLHDLRPRD